jgi:S-DNA-T family DNA segregation ATPase FtsK/SpoIIIE
VSSWITPLLASATPEAAKSWIGERREDRAEPDDGPDTGFVLPGRTETPILKLRGPGPKIKAAVVAKKAAPKQERLPLLDAGWNFPSLALLRAPPARAAVGPSADALESNARLLETVLGDYGVQGRIVEIRPGPVVTLYELEPAPGIRSSRVIGLADDIARSLSVVAVRIATVSGRNVIGIEVPNAKRETVYFSELLSGEAWEAQAGKLNLALGKDISGAPVFADLARMPHLLIAGTTGSGKSVGVNAMIMSLLYKLSPEECRLILIDPKMLELSVYDGIPHLMAPVVTEPAKAVAALKWVVREMERRYRSMSGLAVRNIGGYNDRVNEARAKGEVVTRRVQTGFDSETGKPVFEDQPLALEPLPFIVVFIDEMADLMMVAGKEIEIAVQRLAQMARAAGIHVIMATQRPSVDVITGTIKANFPTRISFQVISKFDSRTILGEQGAEQLLGQGDLLYMQGGGRITRVHGPFVSDREVEDVVAFLREQGEPAYVDEVTEPVDDDSGQAAMSGLLGGNTNSEASLYDQAVSVVAREGKASTSFIQRHLNIGYNKAAKLIEQMEKEGVVSVANHVGKREVLVRRERDDD